MRIKGKQNSNRILTPPLFLEQKGSDEYRPARAAAAWLRLSQASLLIEAVPGSWTTFARSVEEVCPRSTRSVGDVAPLDPRRRHISANGRPRCARRGAREGFPTSRLPPWPENRAAIYTAIANSNFRGILSLRFAASIYLPIYIKQKLITQSWHPAGPRAKACFGQPAGI